MPSQPLPKAQRMAYRIGRGEHLVLTFEPYKSELLPLWRFRTPSIARTSSSAIFTQFLAYEAAEDFIGMDMSRKFLQMGMTRAKRYANHKGGRKYARIEGKGKESGEVEKVELEKSKGHVGKEEKEEASRIFREVWERVKSREGYQRGKEKFLKEQREWDREIKKEVKKEKIKEEQEEEEEEVKKENTEEG
ncbi:hypothetical protein N0V83_006409 [Neocucurbitaria cava]|uniref:Uncharacterized protein n=1 Tax=Neocucurbitaria cava TaxID=798079 RepID=A0A9W9CKQ6_9PLEO|nr:hypothetical protein N0V83_006409 [Neocucurbitaria cava]